VVPRSLGLVLGGRRSPWSAIVFTTALALALITGVSHLADSNVAALAGTTGMLLLLVFTVVNVSAVVLRRRPGAPRSHFRSPTWAPYVAGVACLFLAGPWARAPEDWVQYRIGGALLGLGVALWLLTRLTAGRVGTAGAAGRDEEEART
jgi:basic amino acid/polyamine antiporter, APA family